MSKDLTLESLDKSLEQSKRREVERHMKIEKERLSELTDSLKELFQTEQHSIESDMLKRLNNLRNQMSEARQRIIEDEKAMLKILRTNRKEIESEAKSLMQRLNKAKIRYWIAPLIVALSLIIGLVIGMWSLGVAISGRIQTLTALNAEVDQARQAKIDLGKYHLIAKTYNNGIELEKKPDVWQNKEGNWIVLFEK